MKSLVSRIATGIAILGLAAPAFAATGSTTTTSAPAAQTSVLHSRTHKHKVASGAEKKAESKKTAKKVEKKGAVKSTKTETPAVPSATPAPASK
jgi:hypothetical protein